MPNCVRPGCPAVELSLLPGDSARDRRVTWREELGGAIVRFHCAKRALEMAEGSQPVLGCDGQRWNGTAPECVEPTTTTTTTTTTRRPDRGYMVSDSEGNKGGGEH